MTTFKPTRSLFNDVHFKHDNNVCACAVSKLLLIALYLVANLSPEMDSVTAAISCMTQTF